MADAVRTAPSLEAPPRPHASRRRHAPPEWAAGAPLPDHRTLLDRLRSPAADRPAVDPGLAGGLRAWLEDGVMEIARDRSLHDHAVVVRLPAPPGSDRARQAIVRTLFRLAVTHGAAERPFEDALGVLCLDDTGRHLADAVARLDRSRRHALRQEVVRQAAHIAAQWRPLPPSWLPRTADRLSVPLAGGRVVLGATADLVIGAPSGGRSGACIVEVQAGPCHGDHATGRAFLALVETLRTGAPPFRIATYYAGSGHLEVDDVHDAMLAAAVTATLATVSPPAPLAGER